MKVDQLDFLWKEIPLYREIAESGGKTTRVELTGLTDELKTILSASLTAEQGKNVLYVAKSEEQAKKISRAAAHFLSADMVGYYPRRELLPYETAAGNREPSRQRLRVLHGLLSKKPFFAVVSVGAMSQHLVPPGAWRSLSFSLEVGATIALDSLVERLVDLGYRREVLTEEPGSFSLRGSIVDIFSPAVKYPFRLDFFDDELESIRLFDPEKQTSMGTVKQAVIVPAAELIFPRDKTEEGLAAMKAEAMAVAKELKGPQKKQCVDKSNRLCDAVREGFRSNDLEQLLPYFYETCGVLEDYLGDGIVVMEEAAELRKTLLKGDEELLDFYGELFQEGEVWPSYLKNYRSQSEIWCSLNQRNLLHLAFLPGPTGLDISVSESPPLREFSFQRERQERGMELQEMSERGTVVFCGTDDAMVEQMKGFAETWHIRNYRLCRFPLAKSAEFYQIPAWLIGGSDLFHLAEEPRRAGKRPKKEKGKAIESFVDLREGDYVVHENHGIGQYMGIEHLKVGDTERDYLNIRYRGQDKLYVPTDQLDLLQKYIGNTDTPPKVNQLGGREWKATKAKVRCSVQEMAGELLKLYAQREAEKGFAFSQDTTWLWEMEQDFPFEETPDQLDAIADVKADMEEERPMDRLLCGDVGYGKTEVALRAAFKAVLDGKQCAVLVPTTVLAQQHERTFRERLAKFGVTVGGLSRFKSRKEVNETLSGLAAGTVDIIIGTHMLFGKRVKYHDLGLLVIDEEQRFGVAHKEKLKELKKNVDVLSMSATPIPRTLHMSLLGVRDISIIETPPAFRQPVQTYVMERQNRVIKEAIVREMLRDGQTYFIHNRVEDIQEVADELHQLVPEARILVGHGQMAEGELEQVMVDFMNGEADILLATTIVESGLDFPNVNTLIVDESDRLGLSQMYQLRGRVGRSRKQGYAYFFYRKGELLAMPAKKRLAAIRDYTDLGSGFKIALRDMEIRGVGNILGPEQHGHMASVGFDMYCQLVSEEVQRLKGEDVPEEKAEVAIDVACSAYLPDEYIGDSDIKIEMYKKIAEIKSQTQLKALLNEIEDRFGAVPDSVYHLFLVARLKILAEKLGIIAISQQNRSFLVTFKGLNHIESRDIADLMEKFGRRFGFKMGETLEMTVRCDKLSNVKALLLLIKILVYLSEKRENEKNV